MAKFAQLEEELVRSKILTSNNVFSPSPLSLSTLMQAHEADYVQRFIRGQLTQAEINTIGLPWSDWLVERTLRAVSGTLLTAELALQHGVACHLAGGTHHAHRGYGSGFCIFNDLAVTAIELVESGKAKHVLILDCDVHQGDGTAEMCAAYENITTVSWHCDENYPELKQSAGINIALAKGLGDSGYLQQIKQDIPALLDRLQPDVVLYDAGVDVHKDDRLGYLQLTDMGIWQRDQFVVAECLKRRIPTACVIGGGYDRDIKKLAIRHSILHKAIYYLLQSNGMLCMPSNEELDFLRLSSL
ncbi:histone deacetylase [Marinomonas agarivorans]|nr:histone deacetylase [Marinomonas agarivorans]